jgi:beta-1,4-glucosyltransferase
MPERREIAGYPICNTTTPVFIRFLNHRLRRRQQTTLVFANANLVTRCGHLRDAIVGDPNTYVLNDGIALDAASWLKFRSRFRENMNGTDFTPALLKALRQPARVFLVGGAADVVEKVARIVGGYPYVEVAGTTDGYTMWQDQEGLLRRIEDAKPDIVLVALGNPLQEEWIIRNGARFEGCLMIGVGALFNFMAGAQPRAPTLLRKLKLEWAHRLALEPRRLLGRYTIGMARFFAIALLHDRQRRTS